MFKKIQDTLSLLSLSLLAWTPLSLSAQEFPQIYYEEYALPESDELYGSPFPFDLHIGYTSAEGIGRREGYATIALSTLPAPECGRVNPFLDFRLHYLDNSRLAGNFGVGFQIHSYSQQLRGYVFYDFRDTSYRVLNQITIGADWLSPCLDLRINTYWPMTNTGKADKDYFVYEHGQVATRINNNRAWKGVEFSASKHSCLFNHDIYSTVGAYVYYGHRRHHSAAGGKARMETAIWKNLDLAMQYSYDAHFQSRFYAQISWKLPFSSSCNYDAFCSTSILREEIIVIDRTCHWKTNY